MQKTVWSLIVICALAVLPLGCGDAGRGGEAMRVDVDGLSVTYRAYGAGDTVLLVHGAFGHGAFWDQQIAALQDEYRVIAPDLPGHGDSDAPTITYSSDLMVRALRRILDQEGASRVVAVGHSLGSLLVRDLYLAEPGRIAGLFLLDGGIHPLTDEALRGAVLAPFRDERFPVAANGFIDSFMFGSSTPAEVRERVRRQMLSAPQHVWVSILELATEPAILSSGQIGIPTVGLYTPITLASFRTVRPSLPADYEVFLRQTFSDLDYGVLPPDAGHYVMLERADELSERLLGFARDVLRRARSD